MVESPDLQGFTLTCTIARTGHQALSPPLLCAGMEQWEATCTSGCGTHSLHPEYNLRKQSLSSPVPLLGPPLPGSPGASCHLEMPTYDLRQKKMPLTKVQTGVRTKVTWGRSGRNHRGEDEPVYESSNRTETCQESALREHGHPTSAGTVGTGPS